MALVLLGGKEVSVGAVEMIQDTEHSKVVCELEVVEVVCLGRGQEGEVVAGV